eukprot:8792356-Ditylum_brightwellii.AAC.1
MAGCIALAIVVLKLPQIGGISGLKILITVVWWSSWYPGAKPGGGGYIAQRILAAKDERSSTLATLWFTIAHYFIRPWPWILVALASTILFPELPVKDKGK